jgi:hypothetical protein
MIARIGVCGHSVHRRRSASFSGLPPLVCLDVAAVSADGNARRHYERIAGSALWWNPGGVG